ncbi:MAG: hypothetical protein WCQ65_11850 [Fermentimonas sp.]|jgi:hypothetical protein
MALGTNRARILDALAIEIDELLAAANGTGYAHALSTARGTSLDNVGDLFGITRDVDETDANFRLLLSQLITVYTAAGTKLAIRTFLAALLDIELTTVKIYETTPGNIIINMPLSVEDREDYINSLINDIIAAGVHASLVFSNTFWDSPDVKWDTDDDWE